MKNEKTHDKVASEASRLLSDDKTSAKVKSVAGSALTQTPDRDKRNDDRRDDHRDNMSHKKDWSKNSNEC